MDKASLFLAKSNSCIYALDSISSHLKILLLHLCFLPRLHLLLCWVIDIRTLTCCGVSILNCSLMLCVPSATEQYHCFSWQQNFKELLVVCISSSSVLFSTQSSANTAKPYLFDSYLLSSLFIFIFSSITRFLPLYFQVLNSFLTKRLYSCCSYTLESYSLWSSNVQSYCSHDTLCKKALSRSVNTLLLLFCIFFIKRNTVLNYLLCISCLSVPLEYKLYGKSSCLCTWNMLTWSRCAINIFKMDEWGWLF